MSQAQIAAKPLENGTPLPEVEFLDENGNPTDLTPFMGKSGIVVSFIHGTWCPACLNQLVRLNLVAPELEALNVGIVCVAHDDPHGLNSYRMALQLPLRYKLLPDKEPSISHKFGVYDPDHESPYPAVFYAGTDRKIVYSDVSPDPDCKPNLDRVIDLIQNSNSQK